MLPLDVKSTIGQPFIELPLVESTNIYAMDHLQANLAAHGTVIFAHSQTKGKGQYGKNWETEADKNLTMSVILDCSFLSLQNQFPLCVMVAVSFHDLVIKYAPVETSIKWPNDLYWRDRKAGGILIENLVRGNKWLGSVVGIGLNLNQTEFPEMLKNPVSLQQIIGNQLEPMNLAKEFCTYLEIRYQQLRNGDIEGLLKQYNKYLYKVDQKAKLQYKSEVFDCIIKAVGPDGELKVQNGLKDSFQFGEVEWLFSCKS